MPPPHQSVSTPLTQGNVESSATPRSLNWSPALEEALSMLLVEAVRNENRSRGFKDTIWSAALAAVKLKAPQKQPLSIKKLRSKFDNLKKDFMLWCELKSISDFGVDKATGCPSASREVIDIWFSTHSVKARKFLKMPLRHQELMYELFEGTGATGATGDRAGALVTAHWEAVRADSTGASTLDESESLRSRPDISTVTDASFQRMIVALERHNDLEARETGVQNSGQNLDGFGVSVQSR